MRDSSLSPLERAQVAVKKFSRISGTEVTTPEDLARELVSYLDPSRISANTSFLDIGAVQGEMAVAIMERYHRVDGIEKHIYSLPTSPLAYELTRKVYFALGLPIDNVFTGLYSSDLLNHKSELMEQLNNIRPCVIIGSSPFNKTDGGGRGDSGSALYHRYFEESVKLNPEYISTYMESVWYPGGKSCGN